MDDQLPQLIKALTKLAEGLEHSSLTKYTITGAADWPILLVVGGLVVGMISFMWVDLKSTFTEHKKDNKGELDLVWAELRKQEAKMETNKEFVLREMKECKEKCCEGS